MTAATQIYIGTSGWSYPKGEGTWKGHFYPPGKLDELEYYSQFFDTVEINSTFYRPPSAAFAAGWARRVPASFRYAVKLWQKFTHPRMYRQATGEDAVIAAADVEQFRRGIEPLAAAGKLGVLLAQFPPSFHNDEDGQRVLTAVLKTFGEYPLAVELRHMSWDGTATTALLREHQAAWVRADEPRFASSPSAGVPLTANLAYFRFHGRNAADWWSGDAEQRYRYLYNETEIAELAGRVGTAAAQAPLLFAYFNNHWQGYAPRNANDLKRSLQLPLHEIPRPLGITQDEHIKTSQGAS